MIVLLLTSLLSAAAPGSEASEAYAIVIGNNAPPPNSHDALKRLRYADDDAVRYYELFSRFALETRLLSVLDQETQKRYPGLADLTRAPSRDNIAFIVETLSARVKKAHAAGHQATLYFVFSGHGVVDADGIASLALSDGTLNQRFLYEDIVDSVAADVTHVIVDACHAGAVVGVRGFFDREADSRLQSVTEKDVAGHFESLALARRPNVGVLIATASGQEAHEWSRIESGVFSHEVLSALSGAADVNGDGRVEYTEVQAFVAAANRAIEDPRAVPQIIAHPPASRQNAALVDLGGFRDVAVIEGDFSSMGHFYIELKNGQRYADAHLAGRSAHRVAVPAPGPVFLRTDTAEAEMRPHAAETIALRGLVFAPREVADRGSIDASYRSGLFAAPFGRAYYDGYVDSTGAVGVEFPTSIEGAAEDIHRRDSKRWAVATLVLGGAALVAGGVTTGLAIDAKNDFDRTTLQRAAHEASGRYSLYRNMAITSSVVAGVAGVAAWWLWPKSDPLIQVGLAPRRDGFGVGMATSW
ncbi:MAG: caspase family protein [Deltaproteobacteria bacterium]|nr:caspase family protein [Deltaproteobacteria bacterium]